MKLQRTAWHFRVYMKAYVTDRSWLDHGNIGPVERPRLLEEEAYHAFEEKMRSMPPEQQFGQETRDELLKLEGAWQKADNDWRQEQEAAYTESRSREVRERLYAGKTSLCPYFWSVVFGLVIYYGVVRSTRPIWQMFSRIAISEAAALSAIGLVIVAFIGYGAYESWNEIPTPRQFVTGIVVDVQRSRQRSAEDAASQAAYEALRLRERQAWEVAHPEEVAHRHQQQGAY